MATPKLIANYLYQHPLPPLAIEFTIKDLFPWPEIKLAGGNGNHHLAPHDGSLKVCVAIILTGIVVLIERQWLMWR
jgi:hypothetical protein